MNQIVPNGDHQEASHRIANHLAIVVGMIQTQIAQLRRGPDLLPRDLVGDMLRETAGRIVSVAQLHRHLAQREADGTVDVGAFLIELLSELRTSLALSEMLSVSQCLDANCAVSAEQARTLGILISEIVMNAVKHAHPTGLKTEFSIACAATKDGALALEFCDDGVGLPEGFNPETDGGTGFRLIRTLARSINAEMRIESCDLGLCFHLRVPVDRTGKINGSQHAVEPPSLASRSIRLAETRMEP